ncbi:hypothetical protein FACS1894216_22700 [Synergistales bacterium]|nr:hypothetical protein FACS1894216_22700 [Synergistales bacterium]
MEMRVLSREESEALRSDAIELVYKNIQSHYCSPDIIEKTLLQAVIISKLHQCSLDAPAISFIMDRIAEFDGVPLFDTGADENSSSIRYC